MGAGRGRSAASSRQWVLLPVQTFYAEVGASVCRVKGWGRHKPHTNSFASGTRQSQRRVFLAGPDVNAVWRDPLATET